MFVTAAGGFTFRPNSAVSPSAHRPPDQVHLTGSSVRDGASVSPGFLSVSAAASLSASRLKADTFYSTAAAAAHAQTQSRTALHLRFNRLFTAALRADREAPPTAGPNHAPAGRAFPPQRYFLLTATHVTAAHSRATALDSHFHIKVEPAFSGTPSRGRYCGSKEWRRITHVLRSGHGHSIQNLS